MANLVRYLQERIESLNHVLLSKSNDLARLTSVMFMDEYLAIKKVEDHQTSDVALVTTSQSSTASIIEALVEPATAMLVRKLCTDNDLWSTYRNLLLKI